MLINTTPKTTKERDWSFPIEKELRFASCDVKYDGDKRIEYNPPVGLVYNAYDTLFRGSVADAKAFYNDLIQNQGYRPMSQETKELFRWVPGKQKQ